MYIKRQLTEIYGNNGTIYKTGDIDITLGFIMMARALPGDTTRATVALHQER
jgi:hypothetical protein